MVKLLFFFQMYLAGTHVYICPIRVFPKLYCGKYGEYGKCQKYCSIKFQNVFDDKYPRLQWKGDLYSYFTDLYSLSVSWKIIIMIFQIFQTFHKFNYGKTWFRDHWCPCFGILVKSPRGFKRQSGLPYSLWGGKCSVRSLRSTSGATPFDVFDEYLVISTAPHVPLPSEVRYQKVNL